MAIFRDIIKIKPMKSERISLEEQFQKEKSAERWNDFAADFNNGIVNLKFTDNSLTTSGTADEDLWIFEIGPAVERTDVYVSSNGSDWISVGAVQGATSGVDIDAHVGSGIVPGVLYSYVRLIDDPDETRIDGVWAGADIDAIGAISSGPSAIPVPPAVLLFGSGLLALIGIARRREAA